MAKTNMDKRVSVLENRVTSLETKLDMFIDEMRAQRAEINNMGRHIQILSATVVVGMVAIVVSVGAMVYAVLTR